jgi:hypothetical protein
MILKLKYFFAFITFVFVFSSCAKEYSQEGGLVVSSTGIAGFTFGGAPDSCTGAAIGGTYIAGQAVSDSDTVVISVTVDSTGSYNISTGTIDGIAFNAAGDFTYMGTQNVTLTSSGKPTATGTFGFSTGTNGCSFAVKVLSTYPDTNSNIVPGNILTCTINGVDSTFNTNVYATSTVFSGLASMNITGTNATSNAMFTISLHNIDSITTGNYTVSTATNITPMFCLVNYIDNFGNDWGNALSGQPGTFQVQVTSVSLTRIQGTFSGTLYSTNGTGSVSKTITNGQFDEPIK